MSENAQAESQTRRSRSSAARLAIKYELHKSNAEFQHFGDLYWLGEAFLDITRNFESFGKHAETHDVSLDIVRSQAEEFRQEARAILHAAARAQSQCSSQLGRRGSEVVTDQRTIVSDSTASLSSKAPPMEPRAQSRALLPMEPDSTTVAQTLSSQPEAPSSDEEIRTTLEMAGSKRSNGTSDEKPSSGFSESISALPPTTECSTAFGSSNTQVRPVREPIPQSHQTSTHDKLSQQNDQVARVSESDLPSAKSLVVYQTAQQESAVDNMTSSSDAPRRLARDVSTRLLVASCGVGFVFSFMKAITEPVVRDLVLLILDDVSHHHSNPSEMAATFGKLLMRITVGLATIKIIRRLTDSQMHRQPISMDYLLCELPTVFAYWMLRKAFWPSEDVSAPTFLPALTSEPSSHSNPEACHTASRPVKEAETSFAHVNEIDHRPVQQLSAASAPETSLCACASNLLYLEASKSEDGETTMAGDIPGVLFKRAPIVSPETGILIHASKSQTHLADMLASLPRAVLPAGDKALIHDYRDVFKDPFEYLYNLIAHMHPGALPGDNPEDADGLSVCSGTIHDVLVHDLGVIKLYLDWARQMYGNPNQALFELVNLDEIEGMTNEKHGLPVGDLEGTKVIDPANSGTNKSVQGAAKTFSPDLADLDSADSTQSAASHEEIQPSTTVPNWASESSLGLYSAQRAAFLAENLSAKGRFSKTRQSGYVTKELLEPPKRRNSVNGPQSQPFSSAEFSPAIQRWYPSAPPPLSEAQDFPSNPFGRSFSAQDTSPSKRWFPSESHTGDSRPDETSEYLRTIPTQPTLTSNLISDNQSGTADLSDASDLITPKATSFPQLPSLGDASTTAPPANDARPKITPRLSTVPIAKPNIGNLPQTQQNSQIANGAANTQADPTSTSIEVLPPATPATAHEERAGHATSAKDLTPAEEKGKAKAAPAATKPAGPTAIAKLLAAPRRRTPSETAAERAALAALLEDPPVRREEGVALASWIPPLSPPPTPASFVPEPNEAAGTSSAASTGTPKRAGSVRGNRKGKKGRR